MQLQSPRTRFLKTVHARHFAEMAASEAFAQGVDTALAQMQLAMSNSDTEDAASKRFHMLEGARYFAGLLAIIGDPETTATTTPNDNLPAHA